MSDSNKTPEESLTKSKELVKLAYYEFKPDWKKTFLIGLVPCLIYFIINVIEYILSDFNETAAYLPPFPYIFLLNTLILLIFSIWGRVAYLISVNGEALFWKDAYRQAFKKTLPYLWTSTLKTIIIFGGLLCFIIPGIIYSVWTAFTPFIFIDEKKEGINALIRSKQYVKGYWWPVFRRLAYIYFASLSQSFVNKYGLTDIVTVYKFELYSELKELKSKELSEITKPSIAEKAEFIIAELIGVLIIALLVLLIKKAFF